MKKLKDIILGVTGGVGAYKGCELLRILKGSGFNVSVVMTKEATYFITPLTFQTLSNNKVHVDMFEDIADWDPKHIGLAKWAKLIVIAPATANFIGKLAHGICDDLLSCVCLATKAKIVICPAMNENMYKHEIVQANLKKLKELGVIIIGPIKGRLASGDIGLGHIAELADITKAVKKYVK